MGSSERRDPFAARVGQLVVASDSIGERALGEMLADRAIVVMTVRIDCRAQPLERCRLRGDRRAVAMRMRALSLRGGMLVVADAVFACMRSMGMQRMACEGPKGRQGSEDPGDSLAQANHSWR